ncbi:TetR family transcriptional regulator [Actinoplanes sp. KI2]|uniref:TetR/AcrR family transcriptional regulator n=1 Tax=Actinoplanes sp. KI2 TaxID=2983315 RepID=UPI0021D60EB3|nr:TetR family transcriptional regulator [Actinoplanes sp. KI2]MCU7726385.1 TetR family transcriptional regulator [Actinoplanes sp. KI2]
MQSPTVGRRRPKDRKDRIAQVAAELFGERGYHGVSLEEIAAVVGISAPAVYRHFGSKYAILVAATRGLVDAALTATEVEGIPATVDALATFAVTHRKTAGLYQWEWRYLAAEHRLEFGDDLTLLLRRVAEPLLADRPSLTPAGADAMARAVLSIFGSLSTHRAVIARSRAEGVLRRAALAVLREEPPTPAGRPSVVPYAVVRVTDRRELLLASAIRRFRHFGYHAVNVDDIASGAGLNASSVYRYFPGKAELLAAAFYRASDRVAEATAAALEGARDDKDALHRLIESYVELTFERSDLVSVYLAENNSLPESDRHELRKAQRLHVEEWVRLLLAVRPALVASEARVLTHAALNLVTDLGRWVRFDRRTAMDHHLVRLMRRVLMA